ncbi:myelin protein P0-like isoform X2 [Sander lucioperca]|uniref:myelin protein P0-like isoform X2 n=1 Tax=Sander lucioperca TaxID=283035 RepID=UPI001653CE9A|nr:myelin protein P0-like isoform X2 [Sander lucioperca]
MLSSTVLCFLLLRPLSASEEELTVKPEHDVTLGCRAPSDGAVTLLEWNIRNLKDDSYVFFYRNQRPYEKYQHPRYRGRVELRDPEMRHGDVSVILKNVSVNDTGTYDCRVIIAGGNESRQLVNLTVTDSDPTAGQEGGYPGLVVGLSVAAGLFLLIVIVLLSVLCYKRCNGPTKDPAYKAPAAESTEGT